MINGNKFKNNQMVKVRFINKEQNYIKKTFKFKKMMMK